MQPDRLAELLHGGKERLELRLVERPAGDVGVDLHAERAVLDGAFALAHAGVGRRDRRFRHPAGKMAGVLGADFGEAVVDQLAILVDLLALGQEFDRRHRVGQDLRVVLELIDDFRRTSRSWMQGISRTRLPISAWPLSTIFLKNFSGMKWV